jgi:hypothetical protein
MDFHHEPCQLQWGIVRDARSPNEQDLGVRGFPLNPFESVELP